MRKITPFLWFDGRAEEAMRFYVSIFKNSKVGRVSRSGPEQQSSAMKSPGRPEIGTRSSGTNERTFILQP